MKEPAMVRCRADFIRIPLKERRSKDEKSLVKIVTCEEGTFLSEWSFEDIGREPYGILSKRPMVYMNDAHEAIEKSMWCYERAMVPLVGEPDPKVALFSAEKYFIDQLIADAQSALKLLPYLSTRTEPLTSLSIIGSSFDAEALSALAPYTSQLRLVLALPEAGVLAEAEFADEPLFYSGQECTIIGESLMVTKDTPLVTPISSYETGLRIGVSSKRSDGSVLSFVLRD